MNLSAITRRFKLATASALLTCGLVCGTASADIDPFSLFLIATDSQRGEEGDQTEAYILDLNFDILTNDVNDFSGTTDQGLAVWLTDEHASDAISWGVFAVGKNDGSSSSEFLFASTVNPADVEPMKLSFTDQITAIERGKGVVVGFNGSHIEDGLATRTSDTAFPNAFGSDWGDSAQFQSTGGLDELLPMYIFGADLSFDPVTPVAFEGLWSLDESGNVEFAPVPVPAAIWMFGSAFIGLGGILRRRAG